jgi:hypothetical protein
MYLFFKESFNRNIKITSGLVPTHTFLLEGLKVNWVLGHLEARMASDVEGLVVSATILMRRFID